MANSLGNIDKTIKYATFTVASIFHHYSITVPAQNLLDSSSKVSNDM